jgi:uncharacterized surface anchored protein
MKPKTATLKITDVFLTILITLLLCSLIFSAPVKTGTIKGVIIDQSTGAPLTGATILLLRDENEEYINGTSTDKNGSFEFQSLQLSNSRVRVRFVGYQTKVRNQFTLTEERPNLMCVKYNLSPCPSKWKKSRNRRKRPSVSKQENNNRRG